LVSTFASSIGTAMAVSRVNGSIFAKVQKHEPQRVPGKHRNRGSVAVLDACLLSFMTVLFFLCVLRIPRKRALK
jgi:hypothetical protein